jgi:hypothetical protein
MHRWTVEIKTPSTGVSVFAEVDEVGDLEEYIEASDLADESGDSLHIAAVYRRGSDEEFHHFSIPREEVWDGLTTEIEDGPHFYGLIRLIIGRGILVQFKLNDPTDCNDLEVLENE